MKNKPLVIGAMVFVLFVAGLIWLAVNEDTVVNDQSARFLPYAQQLGLDEAQFVADMNSPETSNKIARDRVAGDAANLRATPTFVLAGETMTSRTDFLGQIDAAVKAANGTPDEMDVAGENVRGAENATVTLIEYSDFQCPACAASVGVVKSALDAFPNDLQLVYRHYPLTIHKYAEGAARAAEAAGKQGKFWEMHDLLFEQQSEWSK